MDEHILGTLAAAFVLGGVGQLLAAVTRLPAIVFLLVLGFAAGPFGLNVVQPANLHGALRVVTSLTVAIILFEGGLTLRPQVLRDALKPVRRLLTAGVVLTFLGAMLAVRLTGTLTHRMVCDLLRRGVLHITSETPEKPVLIAHQLGASPVPFVPLLVVHGNDARVAAIGETCPAGGAVIGLTRRMGAEEAASPEP